MSDARSAHDPEARDGSDAAEGLEAAAAATPTAAAAEVGALPFDRALAELRETVRRLEEGGLLLEEAIALYERGVALHERCSRLLADAELRVQRLVERAGGRLEAVVSDDLETAE